MLLVYISYVTYISHCIHVLYKLPLGLSNVPGSGGVAGDDAGLLTAVYTTGDLAASAPIQRQAQVREYMPIRAKAAMKLNNSRSGRVDGVGNSRRRRKASPSDPWNINGKQNASYYATRYHTHGLSITICIHRS